MIGAAFAGLLVLSPILMGGSPFLIFFSIGGLIIVGGGVITVAFMSFEAVEVRKALDIVKRMFMEEKPPVENLHDDVTAIIYCARLLMDNKGMRNLESVISKSGIRDPFLKYGLNMVLSDYTPDEIRAMLETAADAGYERDNVPVEILQAMTSHGPAFGMIGTLVGMVAMLCNLTDNVTAIGPSLAVAFLSTLYGVLSARFLYMPAASRLRQEVENRRFRNHLVTEGMVMLVAKKTPMFVQDRLNGFLRPEAHDYFDITKSVAHVSSVPMVAAA
jgi:chemotaxis protein MotA